MHSNLQDVVSSTNGQTLFVFVFRGDWPRAAFSIIPGREGDRKTLQSVLNFIEERYQAGWRICQFKGREEFRKGRRLIGQHWQLIRDGNVDDLGQPSGISIGRFQGLVEPLGYVRTQLSEESRKLIRLEYRRGYSVAKLVDDWDVSESLIRTILKSDNPPVLPSEKTINKGIFEPEPPVRRRVVRTKGG